MKSKFSAFLCFALVLFTLTSNCKNETQSVSQEETVEIQEVETSAPEKVSIEPELHPFNVGGEMVNVIGDTLGIQMYKVTMKPGDSIGLHKHLDHTVYTLKGGKLLLYINGKDTMEMELIEGTGLVSGPLTDAAVNIGDSEIVLLSHEILRPRNE